MRKYTAVYLFVVYLFMSCAAPQPPQVTLSKAMLKDKIMGGWAGQTIGVTFGGPYEFRFNGTFIQDYQPLLWYDGYLKKTMLENPGLYDDIYMDLTFVDVFERAGLDAPVDSFAQAFAHAGYMLWHANQSARYNILQGIKAPASGHWTNNPHADDIDYQIESDFAGLMSPGMPNLASAISDKVGHIMNYGDGWYGGVFVGAMYTLAFISDDIPYVITEALKTIPARSTFYQCIADVMRWYQVYPNDWRQTWFELQKKWSAEKGCPEGVYAAFDIDAKINAAYIVLGLLYGKGDFTRTLEIATRAGQDADCNPSSAGGILGAMLGYKRIPEKWKMGLKEAEGLDFKYTTMSLNKVYEISYNHALQMITRQGGKVGAQNVSIAVQTPRAVKLEQCFEKMEPVARTAWYNVDIQDTSFEFEGSGFVLRGDVFKKQAVADTTLSMEVYIDNRQQPTVALPTSYQTRRNELCWAYNLENKKHEVRIRLLGPSASYALRTSDYIIYK
ncbi:ADP-ribosylglycohydrolase family protein [Chitinophaga agrisoli]|uniref:ADP-ribosylglycohydrolase family protein n=1 Tax=Chitinophaga agrisoli TaxID=2607653 RepID=A0A5B2VX22_9BACT|nr:ADP-ribosylglycohydrolase family protein [Chitinophaga agrisoli]KAA2243158.1 ADP-ribosylglycohydrolase family protein [Chitinophaga agrisoli]